MATRNQDRRRRRAAVHDRRCASRSGMDRLWVGLDWLRAEAADADPEVAHRAIDDVTNHVLRVARQLNERMGVRR